ncbi:MAG: TetR/AcrR family transcriptional regulator [Acidobacteria bacterium]|nr:TetR/AcrR family transcriptional regulator [Acidobacteriota bacterium]
MSSRRVSKTDVVADFRRGQILAAARDSLERRGVSETTVDGIARAAGLAKGTVYLYYRSKDEILAQLLTRDLGELQDATLPVITGAEPLDRRLREYLEATLTFFDERREFIEHCQFEISPDVRQKARHTLGRVFAAQVQAWEAALQHATPRTAVAASRRTAIARAIVSLAHGLTIHRIRGWHAGSIDEIASAAASLLWQGLARR